jgi:hypothetical protein
MPFVRQGSRRRFLFECRDRVPAIGAAMFRPVTLLAGRPPWVRNFYWPAQLSARTSRNHKGILEMSDTYIIEIGSQAAGIVVRDPGGYRFFAASHRFNRLEGQLFRSAREAERAARRLVNGGVTLAA